MCYVSNPSCNGNFSQNLRNALFSFSDHLPVVLDIETPQNTLSNESYKNPISFLSKNIISDKLVLKIQPTIPIENLIIYNFLGQEIKRVSTNDEDIIAIDCSDLSKGFYFLKADEFSPLKFLKN